MTSDEAALLTVWNLGDGEWGLGDEEGGWSDAAMKEAEALLPQLIRAGYVEITGRTWTFTDRGVDRALELGRGA